MQKIFYMQYSAALRLFHKQYYKKLKVSCAPHVTREHSNRLRRPLFLPTALELEPTSQSKIDDSSTHHRKYISCSAPFANLHRDTFTTRSIVPLSLKWPWRILRHISTSPCSSVYPESYATRSISTTCGKTMDIIMIEYRASCKLLTGSGLTLRWTMHASKSSKKWMAWASGRTPLHYGSTNP